MPGNTLTYAIRQLRKSPALTLTVVITLALCIGANSAIYSIVDALFFRSLPFPDAGRLVTVVNAYEKGRASNLETGQTGEVWEAVRDHATKLDAAVYGGTSGVNLYREGSVRYVQAERVSAGFFRILGVPPVIGREFTPQQDVKNGPALVILSDRLWHAVFHADPQVVGASVDLRGVPATVVGVMPPGFRTDTPADVWVPLRPSTTGEGGGSNYTIIGRLLPGVSVAAANAQLESVLAESLRQQQQRLPPGLHVAVRAVPLLSGTTTELRPAVNNMWIAALLILVIGCVNVASVLLARSATRSREIATRLALGASRLTIIGHLLCEAVLLGLLGGAAGLLLGNGLLAALNSLNPHHFDSWLQIKLDWRVAMIMMVVAVGASVLFGLFPATESTRVDLRSALADAGRSVSGPQRSWKRQGLVFAEVALGFVLVVCAGLLIRSFQHLAHLNPGFDTDHIVTASLSLQDARYAKTSEGVRLFDESLQRIRSIPGVESAAVTLNLPYEKALNDNLASISARPVTTNSGLTNVIYATPGFFETLRIPILRGRSFQDYDDVHAMPVAVVNSAFLKLYLSHSSDPLNETLTIRGLGSFRVVGLCGDVQQVAWGNHGPVAPLPQMYIPAAQVPDGYFSAIHVVFAPSWIVRTRGTVPGLEAAMRDAVRSVNPQLPFAAFRTIAEVQEGALQQQRYQAMLFSAFAALGLLLAAVGVYGLVAQTVAQRTREMGIRLALGGSLQNIVRSAAAPGIVLAIGGATAGAILSLFATRLLQHQIWGITATDPATFVAVAVLLIAIAALASIVPALRLTRLDPAQTLRHE